MSWFRWTAHFRPFGSTPRLLVLALAGVAFSTACAGRHETDTIISHVAVVDVERGVTRPDRTVVIRGSRIAQVAPAREIDVSRDAVTIDGTGKYIMPGLWDMHVHVSGNDRALELLLAAGVTGARDMGGDFAMLADARRRIAAGQLKGPRLVVAGPMLRGPKSPTDNSDGESQVVRTADEARRAVASLPALGVDFVKVHEDLSREAFLAIAQAVREKRLAFVGHVPTSLTPAEASDAGELSIEHLEWVPDSCLVLFNKSTAPVPEGCQASAIASLLQKLSTNGTWLDPTIGSFRQWAPDQWNAIFEGFRNLSEPLRRSGVRVLAGTDWSRSLESRGAKPGTSLHDELALLVEAGFTPAEALRSATSNAAQFLGLWSVLGSIEAGKTADLVLLEGDPLTDIHNSKRVVGVLREGRVVPASPGSSPSAK
jgi:imidazolonepropionase-like amidohydrolase